VGRFKSIDEFLDLFPSKPRQKIKGGYNVLCPAHNDKNPSLSVSSNSSKILLDCKAGCELHQILAKLNLSEHDLFLSTSQTSQIEAVYQYHDADRKVIHETVRFNNPKSFRQRQLDGNGEYIWTLKNVTPVLYHLPDIIKAIGYGDLVFLTEGEKDADTLWEWGFVATTNPMGAGKWNMTYSESLRGANVVFIPDTDTEGLKHAKTVVKSLGEYVKSLKIIILEDSKDISEWFAKGHTPEELEILVSNTNVNVNTITYINSNREQFGRENNFSLESGQLSGQVVDNSEDNQREWGELSVRFDRFLKENPEPHWKRDVAEQIGTTYKDPSFIKLVQRRADKKDPQIKIVYGGDKIRWINKDWKLSLVSLEAKQGCDLGLVLPFSGEKYIQTLEHSQIVVAGDVGAGKTHFGYLLAELNIGKLPIRHFVNEIGDARAATLLEDFYNLTKALGQNYHLINQDKEGLDVAENLDPNGLNIYDYLHLPSIKEWFLWLQKELARLSQKLDRGVIVVMLQKKRGNELAMGGDSTRMQAETYFNLCIEEDVQQAKKCRVDVIKCKGWAIENVNPELLSFRYHTAPKYGKLVGDSSDWFICTDRA